VPTGASPTRFAVTPISTAFTRRRDSRHAAPRPARTSHHAPPGRERDFAQVPR
jgi:hypothetical protein